MAFSSRKDPTGEAQKFLAISEIRGNVAVMKSHELRAVLFVSSVNFSLKSDDEQEALVYQFQNFLNGLDFPLQILVQSRKVDLSQYLQLLEEKRRQHENELLIIQTQEYIEFVKSFTKLANIMSKLFYVVIPFAIVEKRGGFFDTIKHALAPPKLAELPEERFKEYSSQLLQRAENVRANLAAAGLKSILLGEAELTELFNASYNPGLYSVRPFTPQS